MKKKLVLQGMLIVGVLGLAAGCAGRPFEEGTSTEATALEMRQLVAVPLENGGTLELIEVAPGFIALSETAPTTSAPLVTGELAHLDPETLFAKLRPVGMAEPGALTDAFARRRERLATGIISESRAMWRTTHDVPAPREQNVETLTQGLYSVHSSGTGADRDLFIERWCLNTTGNWSFCDVDRWGSHSRTRNDVDRYACTGATFARTATMFFKFRVWWDWTTLGRWTVREGYWRRVWTEETGGLDYDAECGMSTDTGCTPFDYTCLVNAPKAGFHIAGSGKY